MTHMARSDSPTWTRSDGTPVPLALLNFPELVAAHQVLVSGEWSADDTALLLSAIEAELEARWHRKTVEPRLRPNAEEPKRAA
jgi:hypothetical protein